MNIMNMMSIMNIMNIMSIREGNIRKDKEGKRT